MVREKGYRYLGRGLVVATCVAGKEVPAGTSDTQLTYARNNAAAGILLVSTHASQHKTTSESGFPTSRPPLSFLAPSKDSTPI